MVVGGILSRNSLKLFNIIAASRPTHRSDSETQQFARLFSNVNRLAVIVKLHVRVITLHTESRRLARNPRDRVRNHPSLCSPSANTPRRRLCPLDAASGDFGNARVRRSTTGREVKRFYRADYMHYVCAENRPRRKWPVIQLERYTDHRVGNLGEVDRETF